MGRTIIFGTGSAAKDFLSMAPRGLEIVGLMDNDTGKHGMIVEGHEVLSPDCLATLLFDNVVIAARDVDSIRDGLLGRGISEDKIVAFYPSYSRHLHDQANRDIVVLNEQLGLALPPIGLSTMYLDTADTDESATQPPRDFVRNQAFRLAARRIADLNVDGAVAELGVYQGDQARLLNMLFSTRKLYLFDTFTGFSEKDLGAELGNSFSAAAVGDFSNTSVDLVMGKMLHPDNVNVFPGYFPDTAAGLDQRFSFVSIDVDLYEPTLAGLEWFYARLNRGGYIFVHDYNNRRYHGVRNAVDEFVRASQACCVPLPDFAGSMVITK